MRVVDARQIDAKVVAAVHDDGVVLPYSTKMVFLEPPPSMPPRPMILRRGLIVYDVGAAWPRGVGRRLPAPSGWALEWRLHVLIGHAVGVLLAAALSADSWPREAGQRTASHQARRGWPLLTCFAAAFIAAGGVLSRDPP
jgi:hypothetical protein